MTARTRPSSFHIGRAVSGKGLVLAIEFLLLRHARAPEEQR